MASKVGPGWIIIFGTPIEKWKFYAFLVAIFISLAGLGVGGYVYYLKLQEATARGAEDVAAKEGEGTLAAPKAGSEPQSPLMQVFDLHVRATKMDTIASLVVSGDYEFDGVTVNVTVMSREPDLFNQVLEFNNRKVAVGLADGELWVDQSHQLLAAEDEELSRLNRTLMVMECAIPFLAWQYLDLSYRVNFKRLDDEIWHDRRVAVLENKAFDNMVILHYIDLETGLELRRASSVDTGGDEGVKFAEVIFDEPAEGLKFKFPRGYRMLIDGKLCSRASFNKFEFNKGIASYLFFQRTEPSHPRRQSDEAGD